MTDHQAILEAKAIALKAHPICKIHPSRRLIGFEGQSRWFVVADRGVETSYLAELIIEQVAICQAMVANDEAGELLQQIRDLPPVGGIQ